VRRTLANPTRKFTEKGRDLQPAHRIQIEVVSLAQFIQTLLFFLDHIFECNATLQLTQHIIYAVDLKRRHLGKLEGHIIGQQQQLVIKCLQTFKFAGLTVFRIAHVYYYLRFVGEVN
jgi:hypothetical protein